jgi:hypothetical protein
MEEKVDKPKRKKAKAKRRKTKRYTIKYIKHRLRNVPKERVQQILDYKKLGYKVTVGMLQAAIKFPNGNFKFVNRIKNGLPLKYNDKTTLQDKLKKVRIPQTNLSQGVYGTKSTVHKTLNFKSSSGVNVQDMRDSLTEISRLSKKYLVNPKVIASKMKPIKEKRRRVDKYNIFINSLDL